MEKSASPKADKTPQTSLEDPFTTFIQLEYSLTSARRFCVVFHFAVKITAENIRYSVLGVWEQSIRH
jgi:hypothetical protein